MEPNVLADLEGRSEREAKLIGALKSDASLRDKMAACRELALVGTRAAVPALAELLLHEDLSHMARYALEPIPDAAADDALLGALAKASGRALVGIAVSLGVRRCARATGPLAELLGHAEPAVASAAARSLGRIGTLEAAKALLGKVSAVPAAARLALADGCLACAENLARWGAKEDAAALCAAVAKAEVPEHVRAAAERAAAALR